MYVFGGHNDRRQICQVTGCGLERIRSLAYDLVDGACTVIRNKYIMLCFDTENDAGRVCRSAQSPTGSFGKIDDSNYHHYMTHIASNDHEGLYIIFITLSLTDQIGTVMAVGSLDNSKYVATETGHSKTEIYYGGTWTWRSKKDYPYHEGIEAFEIVPFSSNFLVFGGLYPDENSSTGYFATSVVALFDPDLNEWTKMGNLQQPRHGFGMVEIENKFLIMGGHGDLRTETCEVTGEAIECESREPTVNEFRYYPAMMVVSGKSINQCKKLN